MELKIIHFYPDLMSLYGSYANVSVLRRYLEALGCAVTVQAVVPGESADITGADFLFMGAGTERAQRFAAEDFARYSATVKAAAEDGTAMLFAGTAMELLGASVIDRDGDTYPGIGLASFTTVQADIPAAAAELKADGSENVYVVTCFSDRDKILSQVVKEA